MRDGEPSRAATDRLLAELRRAGWTPRAWVRFIGGAAARSAEQALCRPRALLEVCVLHGVILAAAGTGRRRWVATSWTLSALHLGMLETRGTLGVANAVTLARANLPALAAIPEPWMGVLAAATDALDGPLARRTDTGHATGTVFGRYADPFADAAFWTWATRAEAPATRAAVAAVWWGPILGVTAASFARGGMVEAPRPRLLRPGAALQIFLVARRLRRRRRGRPGRHGVAASGGH